MNDVNMGMATIGALIGCGILFGVVGNRFIARQSCWIPLVLGVLTAGTAFILAAMAVGKF